MPLEITVSFDELICIDEWDLHGHSEPYIWPLFFWTDGASISEGLAGGDYLQTLAPISFWSARGWFGNNVEAGDKINVPGILGGGDGIKVVVDDSVMNRRFGILVALLEEDDSPDHAIATGHAAFAVAIHRELNDFVRTHFRAPVDEEVHAIADVVREETLQAIDDDHSTSEKLNYLWWSNSPDGFFAHAYRMYSGANVADSEFTLDLETHEPRTVQVSFNEWATVTEHQFYQLTGKLRVREVAPAQPPPCEAERQTVEAAEQRIVGLDNTIEGLQQSLSTASPGEKAGIIAQIKHIQATEIPAAVAQLEAAKRALYICQRTTIFGGGFR
ncbi:MAG: hypothetical protein ACE5Q6_07630 [Dehalococcoidia bacterium]